MKKLLIVALVVVFLSLLGIVNNARLLAQVDEVATRITFMNAFSPGETHVNPAEWRESTTRNAVVDIVLYAAGFVCGIGLLWRQRWARSGTIVFSVILVVMALIGLSQVRAGLFMGQFLLSAGVALIGWRILYHSNSAALFLEERSAQRLVRERPKARVEVSQ